MTTRILIGDVRERLRDLPTASVDCVVTSPPYWGLRSYLDDGHPDKPREIGLERTLGEHLDVLVAVFRDAILIELNREYAAMAQQRIIGDGARSGMSPSVTMEGDDDDGQQPSGQRQDERREAAADAGAAGAAVGADC